MPAPVAAAATPAQPGVAVASTPTRAATFNGDVRALGVFGNTVYVGGTFTRASDASGTVRRRHVAALDATTGQVLGWNPGADGVVDAIAVTRSRVYLGGEFEHVAKGVARRHLAAIRRGPDARVVRGWRFDADRYVKALAVTRHGLYVGGGFTTVGGVPRQRLALVGSRDRLAPRWKPGANDTVLALAVTARRVYVGGLFGRLNGHRPARNLAALSPTTGRVVGNFDPAIRMPVNGLRVSDDVVYVAADGPGGHLQAYGPAGRRLWTASTDGAVNDLAVMDGIVYFGGHFEHVCTTTAVTANGGCVDGQVNRGKLAAVGLKGRLRAWNPNANSLVGAFALRARAGRVFAGGGWTTLNGGTIHQPHYATFIQPRP
ncbi:MAG: hypothetical protein H0V23_09360 [Nocardioidaceae bacterium]|nr:hypothetical protein [Nocardioidaceae bacterium]